MSRFLRIALLLSIGILAVGEPLSQAAGLRPFKATINANWDNIYFALPVELGGLGQASFAGGGQVSHLGRSTQTGTLSLGFPNEQGLFPGFGTVTTRAANGDLLVFDYEGILSPATGEGIGTFTFTGGTGRFANATGSGTFAAIIDTSIVTGNQPMTVVLNGNINY